MKTELHKTLFDTTDLGSLIAALERAEPADRIMFDFCYAVPTTLRSYRGSYDQLALGWDDASRSGRWPTVADLLTNLRAALVAHFGGYKGGNYSMTKETPVWVDNWGDASSTCIVAIEIERGAEGIEGYVTLFTERGE